MKNLSLILIFISSLFSQTVKFKETKFIEALDTELKKFGNIKFQKNFIETSYLNSNKILLFKNDMLLIKEKNKVIETIDLNRDMGKKIYYTIIKSIYLDDLSTLSLYFDIKEENKKIFLVPKSTISNYLKNIEFKKNGKNLDYLIIYKTNNDWIKIEQTN